MIIKKTNILNNDEIKILSDFIKESHDKKRMISSERIIPYDSILRGELNFEYDRQTIIRIVSKIIDSKKEILQKNFKIEKVVLDTCQLTYWRIGDTGRLHADKEELDGRPNPYPQRDFGSVYYLNDDYDGGEIYFPDYNINEKPQANSIMVFPGTAEFSHGVKTVMSKERLTAASFWTVV